MDILHTINLFMSFCTIFFFLVFTNLWTFAIKLYRKCNQISLNFQTYYCDDSLKFFFSFYLRRNYSSQKEHSNGLSLIYDETLDSTSVISILNSTRRPNHNFFCLYHFWKSMISQKQLPATPISLKTHSQFDPM